MINDLLSQALDHHRAGQLAEAEPLYRQILASAPGHAEALHYLGILCAQTNRPEEGLDLLQRAVAAAPARADFHFNLANALEQLGRSSDALAAYQQAVTLDPTAADAWTNLGLLLQTLHRPHEAVEALYHPATLDATNPAAHHNLALALYAIGRNDQALAALRQALQLEPTLERRINLGTLLLRLGDPAAALAVYQQAAEATPNEAAAHLHRGHALAALKRHDEAVAAYRRAQALNPAQQEIDFLIAALTGASPPAPPPGYVADLFDRMADTFDEHLRQNLEYRAPELLFDALRGVLTPDPSRLTSPLSILDAGCGTGLCGPLLRPLAARLVGVDLSPAMLAKAQALGLYDELVAAELVAFLGSRPASYDLIFAADVLLYLGDLSGLLAAAHAALRPSGLLAFTVEALSDGGEPYLLQPTRRYAHALSYLRPLAARHGFAERHASQATLRMEKGVAVAGHILVLQT